MNWAMLILGIIQLVPTIAQGIVTIKADCDLGDKKKAASDSLAVVTNAALAVVPADQRDLATAAAAVAHSTMDAIVTALHTTQQQAAVPAASLPAAA